MFFGYGNGINRNLIYGVLLILVLYSLTSIGTSGLISIALTLPAVIIAITFHEFAHAFIADKLGDTTPRNQGRLTLNPLAHLDLFGFVLMIFAHIGWGKPVQINSNNFNSNKSRSFCESMVSLAGPLMNFLIAIIACIAVVLLTTLLPWTTETYTGGCIYLFLNVLVSVNIGLGVFNLIPLPPLDGEKIFRHILPYKAKQWLDTNYQTLYWIFMILWIFGFLEIIVSPVISFMSKLLYKGVFFIVKFFI